MPTRDPARRLRRDPLREALAATILPNLDGTDPDASSVGLEVELLPVRVGGNGAPGGRVRLDELRYLLGDAYPDRLTFEPGGQLEISGACHVTSAAAIAEADEIGGHLAAALAPHGVALAGVGLDPWHHVDDVAQQLVAPRYPAMATYLARRGPAGAVMMRNTCALQVNLDTGSGSTFRERWLLAHLIAPLLTASFANSPSREATGPVNRRALTWQRLDPTRTGLLVDGPAAAAAEPLDVVERAVLRADVLLFRTSDGAVPGEPGFTFADWLERGHPTHGWPDHEDLRIHLSTIFHEVRPRGWLELRSIDALPPQWRSVPVTILTGLFYDPAARGAALAALQRILPRLPELLRLAATVGVAHSGLCAAAVETWSFGIEGARRAPLGAEDDRAIRRAERFLDHFTMRGRAPADDLRQLLRHDAADALAWLAEPVPTVAST